MAGKPKFAFFIVVGLVVVALVAFAGWQFKSILFPTGEPGRPRAGDDGPIEPPKIVTNVEAADTSFIGTEEGYEFVAKERLTPVSGVSDYEPLEDNTVKFALNVWAGWAPIILANDGAKAGKTWKTPDGKEFKVSLILMDDPTIMQEAFAGGRVHIGWSTVDMIPLFMERLVNDQGEPEDSRAMPRIYQQVDWSNGGDGIVVRENIKEVKDLRGKKIALAQFSPSHYFLLNMLVDGGVQPSEVDFEFTGSAFQAANAFNSNPDIAACVSWAPDIYNLADIKGNKMLVDTTTANRLIADVWFARADFARDNPGIMEALVRGIFDAMRDLEQQSGKQKCAELMAGFYNIPKEEIMGMFADAHGTGWGDNYQFFVNKNYLANFERVWNNSYYLYRRTGDIQKQRVSFDKVMDNSIIKKLGEEEKYRGQKTPQHIFSPSDISQEHVEEHTFLTTTHYIHFYPDSADPYRKIIKKVDGKSVEELYDPNVEFVIEKIGEQIGKYEFSRIAIEGHTDASMKGKVDEKLVKDLSQKRAQAIKDALLKKYPDQLDPNRFTLIGRGWDDPADPNADQSDPSTHAKNRRVEVRVLPAEVE